MNIDKSAPKARFGESISVFILVVFLTIRVLDEIFLEFLNSSKIFVWDANWYNSILFIAVIVVIWLNRWELQGLNVDKQFVIILIFSGLLLLLFYLPLKQGIFVGIATLFLLWLVLKDQLFFNINMSFDPFDVVFLFISLIPIITLPYSFNAKLYKDVLSIKTVFFATYLPSVVFEEFLFRGLLWMYLQKIGLTNFGVIFFQAFIFWISHHRYIDNPYVFWFVIPFESIVFGWIILRSKALTKSTIAHFLFNFLSGLLLY